MADNFATLLADRIVGHSINLMQYEAGLRQEILGLLYDLRGELVQKITSTDPWSSRTQGAKFKRLETLLKDAEASIASAYKGVAAHTSDSLLGVAEVEVDYAAKSINSLVGADIMAATMSPRVLKSLVDDNLVLGAPAKDWWSQQAVEMTNAFKQQMRMAMASNEDMSTTLQRVRGVYTGRYLQVRDTKGVPYKVPQFTGGLIDTSTRKATALIRTSVQSVANAAREATYTDNDDVVKGVQILVTLDGRTSDICKSRSGASWSVPGHEPLNGTKIAYPGPPPYHFQCRSTLIPIVKTFAEIAGPKSKLSKAQINEIQSKMAPRMQSSMDGQVAGNLTYEDWLKSKPVAFQKEVLGEGKWDLWQKGKIGFTDLVDQTGRSLSLVELRVIANTPARPLFEWKEVTGKGMVDSNAARVALRDLLGGFGTPYVHGYKGGEEIKYINAVGADTARILNENPGLQAIYDKLKDRVKELNFVNEKNLASGTLRAPASGEEAVGGWAMMSGFTRGKMAIATKGARLEDSSTVGQWIAGKDFKSLWRHEYAHLIEAPLRQRATELGLPMWNTEIFMKKDKKYWSKGVSQYGATDHNELFAEAFSAFTSPLYGKPGAKQLAPEVHSYFTKLLKE